jgi:hypothetical protein
MKLQRPRLTRRRFFEHTGALVGAATLGACGGDEAALGSQNGILPPREGGAPGSAVVGVVRDADVDAAVARASSRMP